MGIRDWFSKKPIGAPSWPRPLFEPGGRAAEGEFFCYSVNDVPIRVGADLYPYGYPLEPQPGVGVRTDSRERGGFDIDELAGFAELDSKNESDVARIRFRHVIIFDAQDPGDLGYLQAAWATVRYFVHEGAFAVRDLRGNFWRTREQILNAAVDDPTLACGWRVNVERTPTDNIGCLVHTTGLAKFGRPDLIAAAPPEDVDEVADVLNRISADLASGRQPRSTTPGLEFVAYVPGLELPARDFFNEEVIHVKFT